MFGLGMPEVILILAIALIIFGPKKLPELARSLGKFMNEFKKYTSDIDKEIKSGMDAVSLEVEEEEKKEKKERETRGKLKPKTEKKSEPTTANKKD